MPKYNQSLTAAGISLLGRAAGGEKITYTRLVLGDGELLPDQSIIGMEAVIHPRASVSISQCRLRSDGMVLVSGKYTNKNEETGFYYRELGLYAKGEDNQEILYCYGNSGDHCEWIEPAGSQKIHEKDIAILTAVGSATNITAYIDENSVVTLGQFEDYIQDVANAVSKAEQALETAQDVQSELTTGDSLQNIRNDIADLKEAMAGSEDSPGVQEEIETLKQAIAGVGDNPGIQAEIEAIKEELQGTSETGGGLKDSVQDIQTELNADTTGIKARITALETAYSNVTARLNALGIAEETAF